MTQASDIVLNGDSYMLVPGKGTTGYTRAQDGMDEGRTGRISQTDFFGGLHRAIQLEKDRGWAADAVGPAHGGQGIQPWPASSNTFLANDAPLALASWEYPSAVIRDHVFFGVGQYLYRTDSISAGTFAPPTRVYDAGAGNIITSLCYYGGNILACFGNAKEITHLLYPDATSPSVLFADEKGYQIVSYQGYAIWSDARTPVTDDGYPNMLRMVTGTGIQFRWVDSPITRLTTAQAEVTIATSSAVYSYAGRVAEVTIPDPADGTKSIEVLRWSGDVRPFFQHGTATGPQDFRFILGYGGRTYAWIANTVMEHDPEGDRAGWRDTGLGGTVCHGACVAAGYLVVSLVTHDGASELWAWDGAAWWRLHRDTTTTMLTPIPLAGCGGLDVAVPIAGTDFLRTFRLVFRSPVLHHYRIGASHYTTSMIDAGERDKAKAWRKIGAVFASPDLPGAPDSLDAVSLILEYSIDAGATWSTAASLTVTGNAPGNLNRTLDAAIGSEGAVSRFLMLRVRWESVSNWAPILVGVWAEFETLDSPARRRRWQFTIQAQDQVIDRNDEQLTRTGREQISELWDHWQQGTTVPFRDLDYDDDSTERRVRIVGIHEAVPAPHQAGNWGQSAVSLTLVEV